MKKRLLGVLACLSTLVLATSCEASGHKHEYKEEVINPTCVREGYTRKYCIGCDDETKYNYKNATGHAYGDWVVAKAATELEEGTKERTCSVCSEKETAAIPKLDHTHTYEDTIINPTCTEKGYTNHVCSVCNDSYKDSYVNELGHTYEEKETIYEATSEAPGMYKQRCSTCCEIFYFPIPQLDHTHSYTTKTVYPTCIDDGYQLEMCSCGDQKKTVLPAKGHTYSTTYTYDDNEHWMKSACGHEDSEHVAHTLSDSKLDEANSSNLVKTYYQECECGYKKATVEASLTADGIVDVFEFDYNNAKIYDGFEIISSFVYDGHTYEIEWTVEENDYISVELIDGKYNFTYTEPDEKTEITVKAKFTDEDLNESEKEYKINALPNLSDDNEIVFYHTMGESKIPTLFTAIEKFEADYPGWTVNQTTIGGYDDVYNKCNTSIEKGVQPSMAYAYTNHVASYLSTGVVQDLSKFVNSEEAVNTANGTYNVGYSSDELNDFIPSFWNENLGSNYNDAESNGYSNDSILAVPYIKSTEVLYYNKTLLDSLHIDVPTTWDELWDACEKIKLVYPEMAPLSYDNEGNWFITQCILNGWDYVDGSDNPYKFITEEAQTWLEELHEKYTAGLITTQQIYSAYTSNLFKKGTGGGAAFSIGSSADALNFSTSSFTVGVSNVPGISINNQLESVSVSQGPSLVLFDQDGDVNNLCEKEIMTWIFTKYLLDVDYQCSFSKISGYLPVRHSCFDSTYSESTNSYMEWVNASNVISSKTMKAVYPYFDNIVYTPAFANMSTARNAVGNAMISAMLGETSAIEALDNAYHICTGENINKCKTIADSYSFEKNKEIVTSDFELDTEYTLDGMTATIDWECDSILVNIENGIAKITQLSTRTPVTFVATFSYDGKIYKKHYKVEIFYDMVLEDDLIYWYNHTGIIRTISGYVTDINTPYNSTYKNISLYVLDDSGFGGYYAYRVKIDDENAAKIAVGKHVTITGASNTSYNGLIETSANTGYLVVDDDVEPIDIVPKPIDEDFISNSTDCIYRTSTLVSLNGWRVTKVGQCYTCSPSANRSICNILSLENGITTINVFYNVTINKNDKVSIINQKLSSIQVGDIVNVSGIWSKSNEYIIEIQDEDSIEKTKLSNPIDYNDAKRVRTVIANLPVLNDVYYSPTQIALTSNFEGVEVDYSLLVDSLTANIKNGKLIICPNEELSEDIFVLVRIKSGDYETIYRLFTASQYKDNETKVNEECNSFIISDKYEGTYSLTSSGLLYSDVTVEYELVDGNGIATLNGRTLTISSTEEAKQFSIKAIFTCGEETTSKSIVVCVKPISLSTIAQAKTLTIGDTVKIRGIVVARSTKGFVVTDGIDSVFVFTNSEEYNSYISGTYLEIIAKMEKYRKGIELAPCSVTELATSEIVEKTEVPVSKEALEYYTTLTSIDCKKIFITGEIEFDGDYINIDVGSDIVKGSVFNPDNDLRTQLQLLEGVSCEVIGYTLHISASKYVCIMITSITPIS